MKIVDDITLRLRILKINVINTFLEQTAYFGENIGSVISTTFYTLSLFAFIKILYTNVDTFAGYNENQMVLLIFLGQFDFYTTWLWSMNNINNLLDDVNSGNFDLILTKPLPSLFYTTFRKINLLDRLKDGIPNLLVLGIIINWGDLGIKNIWQAGMIFIFGQISWHCYRFLFSLPVFWLGQSTQISALAGTFGETRNIPLEGFDGRLKWLFLTLIPSLVTAQLTGSVLIGKSDPYLMLFTAGTVAAIFITVTLAMWKLALKNYTSASS